MNRAVLWDMDGTLVDSEEYHWLSWRDSMAAANAPITHADFLATFGWRNDAILPRFLGDRATPSELVRIGNAKEVLYRQMVRAGGLAPLAGAAEWVRRLRAEGWRQAVASSAPRENVEVVLEVLGMDGLFDAITSAEDVVNGKPAPDVFLTAASRLEVEPSGCIVVEDADAGVEAGKRAGMRVIGVSRNGKAQAADLIVVSLADLPADAFDRLLQLDRTN